MINSKITNRCPVRTTLELLGGKWRLLIVHTLSSESLRLSELGRRLPEISEKMLIQELKILFGSGLVERVNYGKVPPHVEYKLTDLGKEVMPVIQSMAQFATIYHAKIWKATDTD